ncbi:methyltransferase [Streptomyces sp. NPDC050804]|uniref:methyltransferase n=1 Tax=Streptomyces sp. NPDC050804 TaxID=3154745 RepID=UPI0034174355
MPADSTAVGGSDGLVLEIRPLTDGLRHRPGDGATGHLFPQSGVTRPSATGEGAAWEGAPGEGAAGEGVTGRYDEVVGDGFSLITLVPRANSWTTTARPSSAPWTPLSSTSWSAFEKAVARGGLDDRLSFAGGDFRTSGFPAADAVVFGHVMIDWDVEVGRMLLAKAYEALPEGGAVLIYDTLVGEDRRDSVGALIVSLHMLVDQRGGKGCTTEECFGRLKDAGFRDCRVQPLSGTTDHLITAVK